MLFVQWVLNAAVPGFGVVSVRTEDEAIVEAIASAKATLHGVTERFIAGELENFTVKVPISDGEGTEHFWLSNTSYADGAFSGIIGAAPTQVTNVTEGQAYEAPFEDVTDWMFLQDGLMHGNYTLRALLPHMPPAEARKYAAVMAPVD